MNRSFTEAINNHNLDEALLLFKEKSNYIIDIRERNNNYALENTAYDLSKIFIEYGNLEHIQMFLDMFPIRIIGYYKPPNKFEHSFSSYFATAIRMKRTDLYNFFWNRIENKIGAVMSYIIHFNNEEFKTLCSLNEDTLAHVNIRRANIYDLEKIKILHSFKPFEKKDILYQEKLS